MAITNVTSQKIAPSLLFHQRNLHPPQRDFIKVSSHSNSYSLVHYERNADVCSTVTGFVHIVLANFLRVCAWACLYVCTLAVVEISSPLLSMHHNVRCSHMTPALTYQLCACSEINSELIHTEHVEPPPPPPSEMSTGRGGGRGEPQSCSLLWDAVMQRVMIVPTHDTQHVNEASIADKSPDSFI